uniref:Protein zer-1 homolog-like C-terminal domain-containing protein n=1 Tax=Timema shepardi TaxID=629360 RepID=A0A7R9G097_TIMSH|nr:unnamed protein product [Timema shepardi]
MASDGPNTWTLDVPRREVVLQRMVDAINRWDLRTERNINYRSFEPISYLAKIYHTPQCQHWAVWALANLTTVYPAKYCFLLESEGGLTLLQEIIQHDQPYGQIKELAMMVIKNCRQFREQVALHSSTPHSDITESEEIWQQLTDRGCQWLLLTPEHHLLDITESEEIWTIASYPSTPPSDITESEEIWSVALSYPSTPPSDITESEEI